jgi:hypothetical protein
MQTTNFKTGKKSLQKIISSLSKLISILKSEIALLKLEMNILFSNRYMFRSYDHLQVETLNLTQYTQQDANNQL